MNNQIFDMSISDHQITLYNAPYDTSLCQWGKANLEQGAVVHPGCVTIDPIIDEPFDAYVHVFIAETFTVSDDAQRCLRVPFNVSEPSAIFISSIPSEFKVDIPLNAGMYDVYIEICVAEELYFKYTFINSVKKSEPQFIIDDVLGAYKNQILVCGKA